VEHNVCIDQLGRSISFPGAPVRIVSLVPSQTELLFDLDLEDRVVGITKFCIHPEHWRKTKTIVGGTKKIDIETIRSLHPDLIIGNKEENTQEDIELLSKEFPVWMSNIVTVADAMKMIRAVGDLTQTETKAEHIADHIQQDFAAIKKIPALRTLYLIWRKPWMAAGAGTFIHEMLGLTGLTNCLSNQHRYPELTSEDIAKLNAEVILLSSEPYPFQKKHIHELKLLCPNAKILLVDGEIFSWYGSRLLKVLPYITHLKKLLT
jgi:ABC-type Fe3+-hydroxamate transport system substrate-binding protein